MMTSRCDRHTCSHLPSSPRGQGICITCNNRLPSNTTNSNSNNSRGNDNKASTPLASSRCSNLHEVKGPPSPVTRANHSLNYAKKWPSRLTKLVKPSAADCSCPRSLRCPRRRQRPLQSRHPNRLPYSTLLCLALASFRHWHYSRPSNTTPLLRMSVLNMSTSGREPNEMPMPRLPSLAMSGRVWKSTASATTSLHQEGSSANQPRPHCLRSPKSLLGSMPPILSLPTGHPQPTALHACQPFCGNPKLLLLLFPRLHRHQRQKQQ